MDEMKRWSLMVIILSKPMVRLILLIAAIICVGMSYICWYFESFWTQGSLSRLTLLIDPGHGGVDGGAQDDHGNLEKHINLAIGLKVREQLKASGIHIVMTREEDTDLAPFRIGQRGRHRRDLMARIEKARSNNCLFLVSIHCDASVETKRRGAFVFYNYLSAESKELAQTIQQELNQLQQRQFKAAPGKYLIIRQPGITGVLIEVGFLSNPEEAALLQQEEYQSKLALAIAKGILQYCRNFATQSGDSKR